MPLRMRVSTVLAAVVLIAGLAMSGPAAGFPHLWVVSAGWYGQLRVAAPVISERLFNADGSVILGFVPGSERGAEGFAFASYEHFASLLAESPDWFEGMDTVMYDLEAWDASPLQERQDPVAYFRLFADLAHAHGFRVLITPHPNLMRVPGGRCTKEEDEHEFDAYIRCEISARAAEYADVVETQAQNLQHDPAAYRTFVEVTAAQARAANPDVEVIAGLSVRPDVAAGTLFVAWRSVRDVVDGFYLSIGGNELVPEAVAFLRLLPVPAGDPA